MVKTNAHLKEDTDFRRLAVLALTLALLSAGGFTGTSLGQLGNPRERKVGSGISYFNDIVPNVPWSIHVVKVDRAQPDLELTPTLGRGAFQGLNPLSTQLKSIPRTLGTPVAAVNGDFYQTDGLTAGDPRGLQIVQNELISGPTGGAVFWIDSTNQPHLAAVTAKFQAILPGGDPLPFGLNEERSSSEAVLYTSRFGPTTRTRGGREFILENNAGSPSLPLEAGRTYNLRIREVRETGNTKLTADTVVVSFGSGLVERLPKVSAGANIRISTATSPDLSGAKMAVGGGPILVQGGKAQRVTSNKAGERHPRTAFGWNEKYYFLVEVDGRQDGLSVGMTLRELGEYLVKLGCEQGANLDGGASATLWLNGRVMNSPSSGSERPIGNGLALLRKEKPAPAGP